MNKHLLNRTPTHEYARLLAVAGLAALVILAVGYVPTLRAAGPSGVRAMFAGVGMSFLAGALGSIPIALAMHGPKDKVPPAILAGTCIRFLVILPLVAIFVVADLFARVPLVSWVAISYLSLLAVDTVCSVMMLRSARGVSE